MALAPNAAYALLQKKTAAKPPVVAPYAGYVHSPGLNPAPTATYTQAAAAATKANAKPTSPAPPSSQSSQQDAANNGAGSVPGAAGSYIPGEGIYAQDSAAAYDAYNAAIAAADKDQQTARAQYGFNADGSNLDPYNTTGLFQRLMRQNAQTSMADEEDAIGRGLGGSGLGAQVAHQHDYDVSTGLADLTGGYQGQLAAALAKRGDAQTALTNALLAARQKQLQFDLENQLFNAFNSSGGDSGNSGGDAVANPTVYFDPSTGKIKTVAPGGRATIAKAYAT